MIDAVKSGIEMNDNSFKSQLKELWDNREGKSDNWKQIVNFLQIAVEKMDKTKSFAYRLSFISFMNHIIYDYLGWDNITKEMVKNVYKGLSALDIDVYDAISQKEDE